MRDRSPQPPAPHPVGTATALPLSGLACLVPLLWMPASASARTRDITVQNAWFEVAPKMPTSGYFTISNVGQSAVLMTTFSSPACHSLTLQESSVVNQAAAVKGMTVTAKGALAFVRGGYHLSCDKPTGSMQAGGTVPVTISFQGGATLTVPFQVRPPAPH